MPLPSRTVQPLMLMALFVVFVILKYSLSRLPLLPESVPGGSYWMCVNWMAGPDAGGGVVFGGVVGVVGGFVGVVGGVVGVVGGFVGVVGGVVGVEVVPPGVQTVTSPDVVPRTPCVESPSNTAR